MRLLIIEDNRSLVKAMAQILGDHHYAVDVCFDGESGLELALSDTHDALIIDLMLPKRDGFSVLEEVRAAGITTPVILLTARTQIGDKVRGLDSGADDYLTKPFKMAELMARLRALSRRRLDLLPDTVLAAGSLELDLSSLTLQQGRQSCHLTPKESQVFELLMRSPDTTINTQDILDRVWGYESDATEQYVQTYVSFLRKKLALFDTTAHIETVPNCPTAVPLREMKPYV